MIDPNRLRRRVLEMVCAKGSGHIGGSFSLAEIVAWLYSHTDLASPAGRARDRLVLSKGHAVPIIYAALVEAGAIPESELETFREVGSRLQGHPDRVALPFIDATTGSLGQGLSIAIGMAIARARVYEGRVFCIVGDGEFQCGQIHEALALAGRGRLNLDNLVCIVDANGYQNDHETFRAQYSNLAREHWWRSMNIDGGDMSHIDEALRHRVIGFPIMVVAHTQKGLGMPDGDPTGWHARVPTDAERRAALEKLS